MVKTRAIVLRSIKFGDSSLIVDMFTEEIGRISFIVRIPRTSRGKIKKQFFQPMNILYLEFDHRTRVELQRLKDVSIAYPFFSIPFEPTKTSILLFLAEFLFYTTRNELQNVNLFKYIVSSLEWLDNVRDSFANFHLVFMLRLSKFIGFFPNFEDYSPGCYFDLRNGSFCLKIPFHSDFLSPQEVEVVGDLMRMNYETMRLFRLSHSDRNRITELTLYYYRLHITSMPELQSFHVLRTLFA